MPTEPQQLQPEIAHVLLIDVVGYSKLLVNEQIEVVKRLNRIVRETACFRAAEARGRLKRLPTGDGMALIFFDSPAAPVECAIQIGQAATREGLELRMGAHSGALGEVRDVNDHPNFAGTGLNIAQRVVNCGDAGHILVSERVAEDLRPYQHWHVAMRDLGLCEVKHGLRLRLFNVCKDGVGNPAVPAKIRAQQRPLSRARKTATRFSKRNPLYTVLIVLLAIGLIALASVTLFVSQPPLSIAVLPFTSLGDASFADGLVGEITTKLENVHQFDKVISQTSVMQYKPGSGRTAPQIAAELHVTYLLEGSVQRIGDHIRVQAQLIDARADKHLWSQQYDNDAGNTFQIQSEICEDIVRRLNLRLSPGEKGQLELAKRTSVPAQDNYTRAGALITSAVFSARAREELEQATALLDRATRDAPDFARAYYQLAHAHDQLYHRFDGTPERLRKAEEAIMALRNLAPDSPETHLARAKHLYWALGDYDSAMDELAIAQPFLPNESMIPALQAYIRRRRSDWNGSYADFARARELDPRNPFLLQQLAINYFNQRRFAEMTQVLEQAIRFAPEDPVLRAQRAAVEMEWHADPKPLHDFIASVVANGSSHAASIADQWLDLAFRERDARAASEAVALLGNDACAYENIPLPRSWCEGRVASLAHDADSAQKYYAECHAAGERLVATQPNFGGAWCVLALADAALGHADAAIEEGKHAAELIPVEKDALNGPVVLGYLAMIYAWSDKPDLALKQLEHAVSVPSYWSYGNLALHPDWDALRGDPRFQQILASLAPKD